MMFSDPQLWCIVLSIVFISALIQGIIGFGYALVAMATLPLVINFREANLLVAFSIVLPVIWIFWNYRQHSNLRILSGAIIGSLIGLPFGMLIFTMVNIDYLVRGTGLVILLITIDGFLQRSSPAAESDQQSPATLWSALAGFCSGFLAGTTSIAGPPIVIYAVRQPWTQDQYKGFIFGFFILISISRAVGLSLMGLATSEVLLTTAVIVPVVILGMKLGTILGPRINPVLFKRCLLSLLAVFSLYMLIMGSPTRADSTELKVELTKVPNLNDQIRP
ncbi:MAG: sulfite exporter TauE/SafE family protein [Planctomycetes bacterium]|nr:sulfite exporter TauE/SafE family protein [Planctomycetota bacterium]MCH9775269.1 sulfite exporter TauE/SafE family protein [Planctomycetota bacterium]MCH9790023.1 sulfite exporter TauE/SafE family protein [Planctomycetota bacterium]